MGGDKGYSRRGIKLVYRPVETDSSGFNIPLFLFSISISVVGGIIA